MRAVASLAEVVDDAVRVLVAEAHPTRIILFGSVARGNVTEGSDLDFLVVLPEVRDRYIEMAHDDLNAAKLLLQHAEASDTIIGFHCQQATEKALKAVLAEANVDFPCTHNLLHLTQLLAEHG